MNKETVRDMLQNRVYTGRVPYAETEYSGTLGEGKKSSRGRREWYEGKHQGFISDELFETVPADTGESGTAEKSAEPTSNLYRCMTGYTALNAWRTNRTGWWMTTVRQDASLLAQAERKGYYRCRARDRGYDACGQGFITVEDVD